MTFSEPPELTGDDAKPRQAVRVLIIDHLSQLLLVNGRDSTNELSTPWWFTVGGGVKPNEDQFQALTREVYEETGLVHSSFIKTPFTRTTQFIFESQPFLQHETYFVAHTKHFEPKPQALSSLESRSLLGFKWWTLDELETTQETIYPKNLFTWFEYLLRVRKR